MISKKLTSKSGITIPKSMRAELGWQPGMAVDMIPNGEGGITLRPHVDLCRFCGTYENVRKYKDICLCDKCAKNMKEVI